MYKIIAENIDKYKYWLIAILSFAIYAQTIGFGLTYCDDHDIILTYFDRISKITNLSLEFFKGYIGTDYYRPMINISFLIDAQIGGQNLWIYHLSSIIYHTLFSIFLYKLFIKLEIEQRISIIATLIFVVHPINVNAVAWVVGRNDTIMGLFSILSFIYLIDFSKKFKLQDLILFALFLLLSILSKESGLFFIPVMFFYLIAVKNKKFNSKTIIYSIVTSILILFLWFIFRSNANLGENINKMGIDIFLFNLRVIPEYVAKFFFPFHKSVLATYNTFNTVAGIVIIASLITSIFLISKKRELNYSRILFGAFWFLMPIVPTLLINILNVNDWNEYVECRAYLPVVGLIFLIIELLPPKIDLFSPRNSIIIASIISILAFTTIIESRNYKDSITFYESAVSDNSEKPLFHFALSRRYREKNQIRKEEQSIRRAMELRPKYAKYPYNFGIFFFNNKQNDSAIKYLNIALSLDSKYREVYKALGSLYFKIEDYKSAYQIWNLAKKNYSDNEEFELNMITALFMMEDYPKTDSLLNYFAEKQIFQKELFGYFLSAGEKSIIEKKYNRALKAFGYCILINPKYLDPYLRLFDYYVGVGKNYEKANYYYNFIKKGGANIPSSSLEKLNQLKKSS